MQVTREDLNPCTVQLTVVCDQEQVQAGYDKAYKQIAKQVKVPGFRPGHAPRSVLEKMVDPQQVAEQAVDQIIRRTLTDAVKQQSLEVDGSTAPMVELKEFKPDEKALEYTAKIPLPAKVELGDPKGLSVQKPPVSVTDEEVEYQVEELRKRRSTRESVTDRGVQEGDVAVVNFKLEEGGTAEGRNFMLVAGQTFPQLDEALSGMKIEEIKSLELSFPEKFQEKDWAGKTLKVRIQLNSITAVKLPELDESFAQAFQTENVEQLKTRMRESIEEAKNQMLQEIVADQLFEKLLERSTVHVSDNMWENLANRRLQDFAQEQGQQGKTLEQYAQENGMTIEAFVEAQRENARASVVRALLIKELFIKEKMTLSNQDLNEALFGMANEYGVEPKQMLEMIQKSQAYDELRFRAMAKKAGDYLAANAEVTEAAAAADEKPKAKKAAKSEEAPAEGEEKPKAKKAKAKA